MMMKQRFDEKVKQRFASTRQLVEKRILRLERALPILVDFAEDRVYFRGLNIALFTLVLLFIIRAGLFTVFLQFPLAQDSSQKLKLDGELGTRVYFGGAFAEPVKVRVTKTSRLIPVVGRNISLRVELALPDLLQLRVNGFDNTITHLSGIALKGSFSISGFPPLLLEKPLVTGTSEVTDINGDATFRNLRIYTGVPGAYLVTAIDTVDGSETKIGKVQVQSQITSVFITEDGRRKLEFGRRGVPPRIVTGEPLPRLQVKVMGGANKKGLEGKMCVLTSASRETIEFSNVGARPDVFHPRLVIINNPYSTLSDDQGFAEFRNVTFSTTIKHVRLWIVCDGRVANYAGSKDRSLVFTAVRKNEETHALIATILQQPSTEVLEGESFSRQPSLLLQYRSLSTGQLTPATGVVAFAYPFMQAGFKSRNIMSPAGAAELEMLRESEQAVLGNLGRVKQLFNLISSPSDARGIANFTNLGFIRHGEAGVYTLGFASTGLFDELESDVIKVKTSVAEVLWVSTIFDDPNYVRMAADVQGVSCDRSDRSGFYNCANIQAYVPDVITMVDSVGMGANLEDRFNFTINMTASSPPKRVASAICNWPVCRTGWGSSSGFVMYDSSVNISQLRTDSSPPTFRDSPSGVLSSAPILYISDRQGRKLAGKYAVPVTSNNVEISEIPFKGASVTKLNSVESVRLSFSDFYALIIERINSEGVRAFWSFSVPTDIHGNGSNLPYRRVNIGPDASDSYIYTLQEVDFFEKISIISEMRETSDQSSFFRIVNSPRGFTQTTLYFDVEGVRSNSTSLEVFNLDSSNPIGSVTGFVTPPPVSSLCAHIRILQSPVQFRQDGSVDTADQDSTMSLLFLDRNGLEKPFVVQAVNSFGEPVQVDGIGMYAVDALGYVMVTSVGNEHVGLSSSYTSSLRGLGAATLTIGNYSSMTILREHMLAPIVLQNTNASGHAVFNLTRIRRAQNTWVKFAFVALYADIKAKTYSQTDLSINDFWDGPASCVSEFSPPVSIDSVVSSIEWNIPPDLSRQFEAVGSAANTSEFAPLPALPFVRIVASKWAEKRIATGELLPVVNVLGETDYSFESVPAHVAVTAGNFERNTFTIEDWASQYDLYLPQLDNAVIPSSLSKSPNVQDINQVASISASISSTLGLQLLRWTTSFGNDDNSTFVQIASRPSSVTRDSSGVVSAVASLPRVASTRGNVGVYNFIAFSGGVSGSESIQVSYSDDINAMVIVDHSANLTGLCPLRTVVDGTMRPQRDDPSCQGSPPCSGHGQCVCGICICADGYDGAEDCSVRYDGDDFGEFFSKGDADDSYYKGKYGGLPVYDAQKAMRSLDDASTTLNDSFPLIIFPAMLGVGKFLDSREVLGGFAQPFFDDFMLKVKKAIDDKNDNDGVVSPIPVFALINDTVNDAWVFSAGFKNVQLDEVLKVIGQDGEDYGVSGFYGTYQMPDFKKSFTLAKGTSGYRAFPVLYTCSGEEVKGWWFSPSWSRCSYDQVQVFADSYYDELKDQFLKSTFNISIPSGILSFDHYKLNNLESFNVFVDDYRVFLGGVKTGCYRFKWAYAPQGSGNRQYRRLDDTAHQSQALSLGFSRPFRALGVISGMYIKFPNNPKVEIPRVRVPRNFKIPDQVEVYLNVRKHSDDGLPQLADFCSDDVPKLKETIQSGLRKYAPQRSSQRCKNTYEPGGLDVTVSVVNVLTNLEYSLYVPSQSADCLRASRCTYCGSSSSNYDTYSVTFNDIQFPSVVNLPPGPDNQFYADASEIPAGNYKLKFRAYGEEVLTGNDYIIALVDDPTELALDPGSSITSLGDPNLGNPTNKGLFQIFMNSSIPDVSNYCYESMYSSCSSTPEPGCFPNCNLGYNYTTGKNIKNLTCLQECTIFFHSYDIRGAIAFPFNISLPGPGKKKIQWNSLLSSFPSSDSKIPVSSALIDADIVYSPRRSNSLLSPATSSELTITRNNNVKSLFGDEPPKVFADFSSLLFESGISGLYILRFSVNTETPIDPGFLLFDVTNPIQEVKVFFNNAPLSRITTSYASASASSRLIESSNLAQTVRVCIVPSNGRSIQSLSSSNSVIVRLLSDPTPPSSSSDSQIAFKAPTKKGDGQAWEALLKSLAGNKQSFVFAEDGVDEDRADVVAGFTAFARSASNGTRSSFDPRSKGTPLGSDGCVEFSDLSFNAIGFTQRVAVVFSVLGVEGPPLILDLVTLLDANPVTTESLQNQIIIPLVIMMPAFGANSQLVDFRTRTLCLILSFVGLAIIASTSGVTFLTSLADFYRAFAYEDVQYVYILSVAWWVCYAVVIAYLVGVTIAFLNVFYKTYKDRSIMSYRERKASSPSSLFASLSETSHVFDMSNLGNQQRLSGFFESHMRASIAYTRRLLPRIRIPIEEVLDDSETDAVTTSLISTPAVFHIKARSVFASTLDKPKVKKLENRPTIKMRTQQAMKYLASCIYQLFTSFESSYEAFFYPQRLIITALVSLICCLVFSALFVYGCSHLSYFAKAALDEFLAREAAAIQTAKVKVLLALDETKLTLSSALTSNDVNSVSAGFELAFQSTVSSVLDQIISETEKSAFGFSIPSNLASKLRDVSNSTLVKSEDPAAEIIRAQRAIAEPWIEASIKNLRSSVSFGLSLSAFLVTIIWMDFLLVYKRVILAVRRGQVGDLPSYFSWLPDRAIVSSAPTFIGIQSIGTMLSFLIFSVIFTLLSFLLSARIVQDFLVSKALNFIGWSALTAIVIVFLRLALLRYVATSGGNISLRSLFSFLDIYFMFFNLVTGAAVAFVRFTILIPFYFILIMRPDIQALPNDPATAAYCSVVLLDSRYNNPIGKVANEILRKILEDVRRRRLEKRRSSRDLRSIVLNPMSIVKSQKTLGGGSVSPSSSSSSSSSSMNSKRIVNRWWLYAMLATHPVLSRYRHREEDEKEEEKKKGGEENGNVNQDKRKTSEEGTSRSIITTNVVADVLSSGPQSNNVIVDQQGRIVVDETGVSVTQHSTLHVGNPSLIAAGSDVEIANEDKMVNVDKVDTHIAAVNVKTIVVQSQPDVTIQNRKSRIMLASGL